MPVTSVVHTLPPSTPFSGAGIYGLYYVGSQELCAPVAELNRNSFVQPIYIEKAVAPGWRAGRSKELDAADLSRRLREHAKSITLGAGLWLGVRLRSSALS